MTNADITPTMGERVWVWRRRQELTLVEAAQRLGVGRGHLVDWEADRSVPPPSVCRRVASLTLTSTEVLRLLRRRSGLGSRGAAMAYGVSHVSLLRLERIADDELKRWYLKMQQSATEFSFTYGQFGATTNLAS
jgi:transcriptional regulator with XRE-family HTH domain